MVMGLVLKEYEPLFCLFLTVLLNLNRNHDGAGIDLVGLLFVFELAFLSQTLCSDGSQIHKT